ncbi:MAG: response regulator [Desulfobacterales bacterium]|nr:response regulator [Desulfobacterales bacterium]
MKKKKILVIDDEQIVLDSVYKILITENYEVDTTLSGTKGIKMAISEPYDVVLTDIRMPDIGGLLVLRDIKRAKPELQVIIITGYATVQSAVQAMKLGASDYIEKPFSPEELIKAIARALEKAKTEKPEEQKIIHKEEVIIILERAAEDGAFVKRLLEKGSDALLEYQLTGPEKLALITGDIQWIESQIGRLTEKQKSWLNSRLSAEIW